MFWVFCAIGGYFLNAVATFNDKVLLRGRVLSPRVFTFYTGITSIAVIVLLPFAGREWFFAQHILLWALLAGGFFLGAFYFMYAALDHIDASRVVPLIAGLTPVCTLIFARVFLSEYLTVQEFAAFSLFVGGGVLLALERKKTGIVLNQKLISQSVCAALFFAASLLLSKKVFLETSMFIAPFIWIRAGSFFAAMCMLCVPFLRKEIFRTAGRVAVSRGPLLVTNKIIGASGALSINYAITLGSVSIVNAMKGLEYFFLFLLIMASSFFMPKIVHESFEKHMFVRKIFGVICISAGFITLVVYL